MANREEGLPARAERVDRASITLDATPERVFSALTDGEQLVQWLPPKGAQGMVDVFEPRPGGEISITLTFASPTHVSKTTNTTDVVKGRFLTLEPNHLVRQSFEFESSNPAFAGTMTMTWTLEPRLGGTIVTVMAENVPDGISPEDHQAGMESSLQNLSRFLQNGAP